ncbi:hypothetical protein DERP_003011 [Dermatophagoides pteronyssinus]|uniref:Uncharacterized protein n=1 Tax=Dermatophagoides pteronyssinus TaxID=6956 RepID=A0ABQ8JJ20_DERPT|nr:hypothetical protein DERP_003011 [Dermatophagoides pteronyssinus]
MQRSNQNNHHRQPTSPSSSSSTNNRRNYNRSHNNFKFHNFVFNETNQKFCLEEQHGNKKITVLHWKSTDDDKNNQQQQQPSKQQQQQSSSSATINLRQCDSDSKLIKSEKLKFIPSSIIDNNNNQREDKADDDGRSIINEGILQSSLSFPLIKNIDKQQHEQQQQQQKSNTEFIRKQQQQFLPHPILGSENSFCSSGHSSFHNNNNNSSSLLSSSGSNFDYNDVYKYSGSSIATTSTSLSAATSQSSSSAAANNINFSLDNLQLNENCFHFRRKNHYGNNNPIQRRKIHHPIIVDNDADDDIDSAVDSDDFVDFDDDDDDDDDDDLFYRTYRRKIQQKLENIFNDEHQQQTEQPLDLSLKKKPMETIIDIDNDNHQVMKDLNPRCDNEQQQQQIRNDLCQSPSTLLSSIKCCSPSIVDNDNDISLLNRPSLTTTTNPFVFKQPIPLLDDDHRISLPSSSSSSFDHHHLELKPSNYHQRKSSIDLFDTLLEEEIQKFLNNSESKTTSSSSSSFMDTESLLSKKQPFSNDDDDDNDEFDRKIDRKLKQLKNEVKMINNKFTDNVDIFQLMSDTFNDNDHDDHNLRMHFKFDLNKNLEPYNLDNNYRQRGHQSTSTSLMNTIPRSRLYHRNQIRRHLEDAFKQNGFLVKTKQISDANNSAMFCKFRQLRKYTRYYLKSWHNHLPDEVNKICKGFLPPSSSSSSSSSTTSTSIKSEHPIFIPMDDQHRTTTSTSSISRSMASMESNNNHLME